MILQCPECSARFAVPDTQIPPQGREVKCGRCKHQWHFTPPPPPEAAADDWDPLAMAQEQVPVPPNNTPAAGDLDDDGPDPFAMMPPPTDTVAHAVMVEEAGLPSLAPWKISKLPFMIATPLLAILWLTVALLGHYEQWFHTPVLKSIYEIVGAKPTDGLTFEDLTMQRAEKDGKTSFMLSGSVANHSSADRIVPTVRVRLLDNKNKELWSRDYVVKESLKGGDVYPFRITNVETTLGGAVATVMVDVGNSIQLLLR